MQGEFGGEGFSALLCLSLSPPQIPKQQPILLFERLGPIYYSLFVSHNSVQAPVRATQEIFKP